MGELFQKGGNSKTVFIDGDIKVEVVDEHGDTVCIRAQEVKDEPMKVPQERRDLYEALSIAQGDLSSESN